MGKTTLLRVIEGLETPDWGRTTLRKGARLGHVPQRPEFAPGVTLRAYVETGLDEVHRVQRELEDVAVRMGEVEGEELERLMRQHDRLSERIEHLGGWESERRVETVLSGIGLGPELWEREARTLSGGEKSRTALARELLAGHDLLLLDEPTNHLDLRARDLSWIKHLDPRARRSAWVIVSHDRRLLDNCGPGAHRRARARPAARRYPGNYSQVRGQLKAERYETEWPRPGLRAPARRR